MPHLSPTQTKLSPIKIKITVSITLFFNFEMGEGIHKDAVGLRSSTSHPFNQATSKINVNGDDGQKTEQDLPQNKFP